MLTVIDKKTGKINRLETRIIAHSPFCWLDEENNKIVFEFITKARSYALPIDEYTILDDNGKDILNDLKRFIND